MCDRLRAGWRGEQLLLPSRQGRRPQPRGPHVRSSELSHKLRREAIMRRRYAAWKSGYKVVYPYDSALCSLVHIPDRRRVVDYALRRTTKPRKGCGPLCVFRTLRRAKNWAVLWRGIAYKCLYKPSKHGRIWGIVRPKEIGMRLVDLPRGTVLADRVRLMRKV